MLKRVNQKNRRSIVLLWFISLCALLGLAVHIFYPWITVRLILNTLPFPSSNNAKLPFYGENIDMSQILPGSQHYIVNSKGEDLIDIAAQLGVNIIRITNAERSFQNNADSLYTKNQWDQVLDKIQSNGMKALILIEVNSNNGQYYTPNIQPVYLHLVQQYIDSGVFDHPAVYAVDIKNEPLLTDANIAMLQKAHAMIKAKYPDLKQTIGWWATPKQPADPYNPNNYNWSDFSAGKKIASMVDFYSIHMYGLDTNNFGVNLGPDLKAKVFLSQVEAGLQTKKPILIEEFGEANGNAVSDQDTIGSPELQASIYEGVYKALQEIHNSQFIGSVAFDFYSRNQYPDAWALVKNNGDYLFPAAYILQKYATGNTTSSLQAITAVHTQSYLLRNDSNNTTTMLHLSDRVGLKLQLDASGQYSLSLDTQDILQPLELLYYNPISRSYYAVYQAVRTGSVQLTITAKGAEGLPRLAPVYKLTIHVDG